MKVSSSLAKLGNLGFMMLKEWNALNAAACLIIIKV
jgi:hypothetical protein